MQIKVPGVAYTALALALTGALGGWLTQYVESAWVPIAVLGLNLIAKAVEIYFKQGTEPELLAANSTPQRSVLATLLLG
jgi:hypothetical protein